MNIIVQTRASRNEIVGLYRNVIKIRLTAAPIDGKANTQLVKFLAKCFTVSASQVVVSKGQKCRMKIVQITDPGSIPTAIQMLK